MFADRPTLATIVPTLNEAAVVGGLVATLLEECDEVIVVDGGSIDETVAVATAAGATVMHAPKGRGSQLRAGVGATTADLVWLLHADAHVPSGAAGAIRATSRSARWGCCAVQIDSDDVRLQLTSWLMNRRAQLRHFSSGDMGQWFQRSLLSELGGVPDLPAFEDLVLSKHARKVAPGAVAPVWLGTSSRRWRRHGINRTVAQMLVLRAGFYLGLPPAQLVEGVPNQPPMIALR